MKNAAKIEGKDYWRSLAELEAISPLQSGIAESVSDGEGETRDPLSRRAFLKLMSASMALAGLAGCRRPVEKIVPYLSMPEEVVLGVPNYYATTMPLGLDVYGMVTECHEGRPTKIEGNPLHPSTPGGSSTFMQAAILDLYDPDRSRNVLHRGAVSSWAQFVEFWRGLELDYLSSGGHGLAVLSESFSSPTLARLKAQFQQRFPKAFWATYEPVSDENIYKGIQAATGQLLRPVYHFDKADVILSLDCDFLGTESGSVRHAHDFAARRKVSSLGDAMNRLYVVESVYSLTGAMADHRITLPSERIYDFLRILSKIIIDSGQSQLPLSNKYSLVIKTALWGTSHQKAQFRKGVKFWADSDSQRDQNTGTKRSIQDQVTIDLGTEVQKALASDLIANEGRTLVVAGRRQPPVIHALALTLNDALGNIGKTVSYYPIYDAALPDRDGFVELTERMKRDQISTLVMMGGNLVYNAPVDLDFKTALSQTKHSIHLSLYNDETSHSTEWHLNGAHFLESWGDARAADGTVSVIQPMIEPLFGGHNEVELLNLLATGRDERGYEIVRQTCRGLIHQARNDAQFEERWRRALHDGILTDSRLVDVSINIDKQSLIPYLEQNPVRAIADFEIIFLPDAKTWDGRFANNGWLQELPDPVTKLTWDNAALISPQTAEKMDLKNGDLVRLKYQGREVEAPVWIQPGQADGSVAVALGYGRPAAGKVGNRVGFDAYRLRTLQHPDFDGGLVLEKTGRKYRLATTQKYHSMQGRPIIREATLDEYRRRPEFVREMVEIPPLHSLWKEHQYLKGYQWGMVIDLNLCTGCGACIAACQAENNIPIVGKEQVYRGREMHWIRVDGYYCGDPTRPELLFQPIPCQHCEMAPCETVCPVAATVHDQEGLNLMTYNRCVGTRYCSNNCPYKVRRFNFFNYTSKYPDLIKMLQNPDVTVRSRGVMEKCTYCLQRINRAKFKAEKEGRQVQDGEIVTACQQACPMGAITFGNVNDPQSRVLALKKQDRNYEMLAEFNTRPRTSYLAKLRNPKI